MQHIETVEVGAGGASSIEFTSIPQDGTDLVVVLSGRSSGALAALTLNSDTTDANYDRVVLRGTGASVFSFSSDGRDTMLTSTTSDTSNTFGNSVAYISNYTSTSDKSISVDSIAENNATAAPQWLIAYKYSTSSAITTLSLDATFEQYSTASLYKVTAGGDGTVSTT